jgi:hypothetical protein
LTNAVDAAAAHTIGHADIANSTRWALGTIRAAAVHVGFVPIVDIVGAARTSAESRDGVAKVALTIKIDAAPLCYRALATVFAAAISISLEPIPKTIIAPRRNTASAHANISVLAGRVVGHVDGVPSAAPAYSDLARIPIVAGDIGRVDDRPCPTVPIAHGRHAIMGRL